MKALLLSLLMTASVFAAPVLTEEQKIEHLLTYISNLKGAVFIRNGSEYSPQKAVEHLRMKRQKAGSRVKTAGDFIKVLASKSSMSGEPYKIRFADGKVVNTADVLNKELLRLNSLK